MHLVTRDSKDSEERANMKHSDKKNQQMFEEEGNAFKMFVRPPACTQYSASLNANRTLFIYKEAHQGPFEWRQWQCGSQDEADDPRFCSRQERTRRLKMKTWSRVRAQWGNGKAFLRCETVPARVFRLPAVLQWDGLDRWRGAKKQNSIYIISGLFWRLPPSLSLSLFPDLLLLLEQMFPRLHHLLTSLLITAAN